MIIKNILLIKYNRCFPIKIYSHEKDKNDYKQCIDLLGKKSKSFFNF